MHFALISLVSKKTGFFAGFFSNKAFLIEKKTKKRQLWFNAEYIIYSNNMYTCFSLALLRDMPSARVLAKPF